MRARFRHDPAKPLRATDSNGQAGHPVIFPARLFGAMAQLSGDRGARAILADEDVVWLSLPGRRATLDLDTPEAWAEWHLRLSTEANDTPAHARSPAGKP